MIAYVLADVLMRMLDYESNREGTRVNHVLARI